MTLTLAEELVLVATHKDGSVDMNAWSSLDNGIGGARCEGRHDHVTRGETWVCVAQRQAHALTNRGIVSLVCARSA